MRCISRLRHDSALPFLAWTRWRQDTTSSISRPPTSILSRCTTLVSLFASVLLVLFCWRETSRSCHSSDASPVKEHYINKHYRDYLNAVLNFMIKMFSSTQVSVSSFQLCWCWLIHLQRPVLDQTPSAAVRSFPIGQITG